MAGSGDDNNAEVEILFGDAFVDVTTQCPFCSDNILFTRSIYCIDHKSIMCGYCAVTKHKRCDIGETLLHGRKPFKMCLDRADKINAIVKRLTVCKEHFMSMYELYNEIFEKLHHVQQETDKLSLEYQTAYDDPHVLCQMLTSNDYVAPENTIDKLLVICEGLEADLLTAFGNVAGALNVELLKDKVKQTESPLSVDVLKNSEHLGQLEGGLFDEDLNENYEDGFWG